jgi:hypothetical protein
VCCRAPTAGIPAVYSTSDGADLREAPDLLGALIRMQAVETMNFQAAIAPLSTAAGITHILDFGPGGNDGIGGSASFGGALKDGTGVAVVVAFGSRASELLKPAVSTPSSPSPSSSPTRMSTRPHRFLTVGRSLRVGGRHLRARLAEGVRTEAGAYSRCVWLRRVQLCWAWKPHRTTPA